MPSSTTGPKTTWKWRELSCDVERRQEEVRVYAGSLKSEGSSIPDSTVIRRRPRRCLSIPVSVIIWPRGDKMRQSADWTWFAGPVPQYQDPRRLLDWWLCASHRPCATAPPSPRPSGRYHGTTAPSPSLSASSRPSASGREVADLEISSRHGIHEGD